jgi:ComF family protein
LSVTQYHFLECRNRPDNQNMVKGPRDGVQPLGQISGNIFPQKCVAVAPTGALAKCATPATVEYFWGLIAWIHLCLVQMEWLSDKSGMEILRSALNFVLPTRCPSCGVITPADGSFCSDCWQQLHFMSPPWCSGCARPFAYDQGEGALCVECLASPPLHDGVRAVAAYDDISKQVALRLKYGGKIGLAKMIAGQLVRHLPDDRHAIIVAPVPLHWTRLWSRSFNQSALIAQELARLGGLITIPDLLLRTRKTPSLRGLSAKERRRAVGKAFAVNPRWQARVYGARIILVDDVLTSGATSDGCVKALKKSGADWVQLFCWARALRGEALPEGQHTISVL